MNPVLETIKNRRSIRSYRAASVPRDVLDKIIEAGSQAPFFNETWGCPPVGRFVVVQANEFRQKLLQAARPKYQKHMDSLPDDSWLKQARTKLGVLDTADPIYYAAPVIIFVIGSGGVARTVCPLACQNIMLAALSLGLGSCWVGFGARITDDAEIVTALELKEDESLYGPIVLGYPSEAPEPPPRDEEPVVKWI
jgi:nitroreductase